MHPGLRISIGALMRLIALFALELAIFQRVLFLVLIPPISMALLSLNLAVLFAFRWLPPYLANRIAGLLSGGLISIFVLVGYYVMTADPRNPELGIARRKLLGSFLERPGRFPARPGRRFGGVASACRPVGTGGGSHPTGLGRSRDGLVWRLDGQPAGGGDGSRTYGPPLRRAKHLLKPPVDDQCRGLTMVSRFQTSTGAIMVLVVVVAIELVMFQGVLEIVLSPSIAPVLLAFNLGLYYLLARPPKLKTRIVGMIWGGIAASVAFAAYKSLGNPAGTNGPGLLGWLLERGFMLRLGREAISATINEFEGIDESLADGGRCHLIGLFVRFLDLRCIGLDWGAFLRASTEAVCFAMARRSRALRIESCSVFSSSSREGSSVR